VNPQDQNKTNPHMADLFRTAIQGVAPQATHPPSIVVTGSHNVISWGGTVYMHTRDEVEAAQ